MDPPYKISLYKFYIPFTTRTAFYSRRIEEFFKLVSRQYRKRKKKSDWNSIRESRGGTVIPARKIAQVDFFPPPLSRRSTFVALFRRISLRREEGRTTRFHWRNEDEERAVWLEGWREGGGRFFLCLPSLFSTSQADLFQRARFQFSRTPARRLSVRRLFFRI